MTQITSNMEQKDAAKNLFGDNRSIPDVESILDTDSKHRFRVPSEKSKQYWIHVKSKDFDKLEKKIAEQLSLAEEYLVTCNDAEKIQKLVSSVYDFKNDLKNIIVYFRDNGYEEEINPFETRFNACVNAVSDLTERAQKVIADLRQLDMAESQSCSTRMSKRSHISTQSIKERFEIEKRAAALKEKMRFIEKENALEDEQIILKRKQEKLSLECELAETEAERKVCLKFEADCSDDEPLVPPVGRTIENRSETMERFFDSMRLSGDKNRSKNSSSSSSKSDKSSKKRECIEGKMHDLSFASDKMDGEYQNTVSKHMIKLIESNQKLASSFRRAPVHVDKFDGDILKYPSWESDFDSLIITDDVSVHEKLNLLKQHLAGEPLDMIKGYLLLKTNFSYDHAKLELRKRYGNSNVISKTFLDKLSSWKKIDSGDSSSLRKFSDFLLQVLAAKQKITSLGILDFPQESSKIVERLPLYAIHKWKSLIMKYKKSNGDDSYPAFDVLCNFVEELAETENIPELNNFGQYVKKFDKTKKSFRSSKTSTVSNTNGEIKQQICSFCKENHHIDNCNKFDEMSRDDKRKFLREGNFCYACGMFSNHISKNCLKPLKCRKCEGKHWTTFHYDKPHVQESDVKCTRVCDAQNVKTPCDHAMIVPVWVKDKLKQDKEILTYCIIDDQSNTTFIEEGLASELKSDCVDTHLSLSTMHKSNVLIDCKKVKNLQVLSYDKSVEIDLKSVYTRDEIPADRSQIPKKETAKAWNHLKNIADKIPTYFPAVNVGLLIGSDVPRVVRPREVVSGEENAPYAQRSILGWGIVGVVCHSESDMSEPRSTTHRIVAVVGNKDIHVKDQQISCNPVGKFVYGTRANEVIQPRQISEMFELDFVEKNSRYQSLSADDMKFMKLMSEQIVKLENGHYQMPLPFKSENVKVPNNKELAVKRILQLKKRFKKSSKLYEDYTVFMEDVIQNYAEMVPEDDQRKDDGRINYIPHAPVYHRKKEKIRIVFDCAARYKDVCLNDFLLQGPDQLNRLTGVLCRFRKENVAIMADIKAMFYQFLVDPKDRDMLRFLWWENNCVDSKLLEYRMKVHLFGAVSSPGCANFGLRRAADDGEEEFGLSAADFVRDSFYVDDGLFSSPTQDGAIELIQNTTALCKNFGLRLYKFASNNKEVLEAIPVEDRSDNLKSYNVLEHMPVERALGINWCIESDKFEFRITLEDKPLTRRGILSSVSSIYDPLGFVAPVVLEGKNILHDMCKDNLDWDDKLPDSLRMRWERWRNDIVNLEKVKIDRCVKPKDFGKVTNIELHHFSDASTFGYGQCSYVRFVNKNGRVHCAFLMGKARVAPLKHHTIPRMELTAALVSAKVSKYISDEMKYENAKDIFWVDSQVVLGYLSNESKRFHVFVANRSQQIKNLSDVSNWKFISTKENPSDIASRGCNVEELMNSSWLKGPEFLWKKEYDDDNEISFLPDKEVEMELARDMKKSSVYKVDAVQDVMEFDLIARIERFSSWFRAKRALANCKMYIHALKNKKKVKKYTTADLDTAASMILKALQLKHYKKEIEKLQCQEDTNSEKKTTSVGKISSIFRLDPFMDEFGILRVGGRIKRASMTFELRHPAIIPSHGHVTELIVKHYHEKCNHMGRGATLNLIRQNGIWLIGGVSAVSRYIRNCVLCKRLRGKLGFQKMAQLPLDRLAMEPPFTYCGTDIFGPFMIKEKRSILKRYGVVFTCMSSRAIHLETCNTLESDSFINALRRFLARRGPVKQLRSDQGTNLIGANNEMLAALKQMNMEKVGEFLVKENCDWVKFNFNVPSASHMGGSWERQIRTIRSVMETLLMQSGSQLDDESLRTFLVETENIVNSRPLCVENITDPDSLEPLTPNHLLKMKPQVLLAPPGSFVKEDLYVRKRWRRVQYLVNEFWFRWRREYVHSLQTRNKWNNPQRSLKPGDVVIISDNNMHKRNWQLGRIESTFANEDDLVRRVRVRIATSNLDANGKRQQSVQFLDRPIHKLVLLLPMEVQRIN